MFYYLRKIMLTIKLWISLIFGFLSSRIRPSPAVDPKCTCSTNLNGKGVYAGSSTVVVIACPRHGWTQPKRAIRRQGNIHSFGSE